MKYIESNSTNPYFNLALEEYLFDSVPTDESCFMLWQNTNTIVIGKYQNAIEEINQAYVDENKISVVRRCFLSAPRPHSLEAVQFIMMRGI